MTKTTDDRRRTRAAMPSEGEANLMVQFHMHQDPEGYRHQLLAQIVYEGRRQPGALPWSKASRKDRMLAYSLTDGLV